jgi:hypothetical protein
MTTWGGQNMQLDEFILVGVAGDRDAVPGTSTRGVSL